jgi:hypothetical protein
VAQLSPVLGEDASIELTLGFFLDRVWFHAYVGTADSPWLLSNELPPYGEDTNDLVRSDVGLSDDPALPDRQCCSGA